MAHKDNVRKMTPEQAQVEFRKIIVDQGIVTEEQAEAVKFFSVNPADYPDAPRCRCDKCKDDTQFMAFQIDREQLSTLQFRLIVAAYNFFCSPFVPASPNDADWLRK